jgi:alkanesulfonate monooxygenase SsuD/methylene tetrahydromethanopterin reductase-like flavin-dependent oxidoreductase (luciferase family)
MMRHGHHVAAWRHPQTDLVSNPFKVFQQQVRNAERACLDAVFFADSLALTGGVPALEPLTLLSALAASTERIGLIGTATTTYNEPYTVARQFASLDQISDGRVGWNLVTSDNVAEAANFGRDQHVAHAERYERAREFHQVVTGLWDSWDADAFVNDKDGARLFDPAKLHKLNHRGAHFAVAGPLTTSSRSCKR